MNGARAFAKTELRAFLKRNPFPGAFTDGLFFRDKMRAIHRIAPATVAGPVLEIGGGRSGLTKLLYPDAEVTNLDLDETLAQARPNQGSGVKFVTGDAADLPFVAQSFDLITMFDLMEHVPDDAAVAREAWRVLKPRGHLLLTTPHRLRWRYPFYPLLKPIARREADLLTEWGHLRRGYLETEIESLFHTVAVARSTFINPLLAVSHDIAFSRLPKSGRLVLHLLAAPISWLGYRMDDRKGTGLEIAMCLQKDG